MCSLFLPYLCIIFFCFVFMKAVPQLQSVTSVSQPPTAMPVPSAMVPQPSGSGVQVATPVAAVESSYFSTAAPTFVPAQASALQQSRPLNEVISSVNSSFNFLQVIQFLQESDTVWISFVKKNCRCINWWQCD